MASFKKIKEILNLQEQDGYDILRGTEFEKVVKGEKPIVSTDSGEQIDHTDDDGGGPWDPDDPNAPIPCNDSPHGCEGCPDGNPEGCYVDENGNYYVSMRVWMCCNEHGQPFLREVLVTQLPNGPLVGVYCTTDIGCQYIVLREDPQTGDLHGTQIVWVAGNLFFRAVQVWNGEEWITNWQYASCNGYDCLWDESSWTALNGPHPEDLSTWEFYVWDGERYPINPEGHAPQGGGPDWGIYINPFGEGQDDWQVGIGVSFPWPAPEEGYNSEWTAYQQGWNTFVNWWNQNALPDADGNVPPPPQPWPEGWTPDGGWG